VGKRKTVGRHIKRLKHTQRVSNDDCGRCQGRREGDSRKGEKVPSKGQQKKCLYQGERSLLSAAGGKRNRANGRKREKPQEKRRIALCKDSGELEQA